MNGYLAVPGATSGWDMMIAEFGFHNHFFISGK
jgi:hypothetical protein